MFLCSILALSPFLAWSTLLASYDFTTRWSTSTLYDNSNQSILGNLAFDGDVTWLQQSIGIRVGANGQLFSINNIASLIQALNITDTFSVETFYSADYNASTNFPPPFMAGPAMFGASTNYTGLGPFDCPPNYNASAWEMRITVVAPTNVSAATNTWSGKITGNPDGCERWESNPTVKTLGMVHLVMTSSTIYMNGQDIYGLGNVAYATAAQQHEPFDPILINPNSSFYIAPIHVVNNLSFVGNFYKFAIYDTALTTAQVRALKAAWLPNSPPFTSNATVTFFEDSNASFFLTAYDYDDQNRTENVTCFVATLPSLGWLLYGGNNITANLLPFGVPRYTNSTNATPLLYVTPQYGYGNPYSSFNFYCSDPWNQSNPSTVSFNISHVNHDPTAINLTFAATRSVLTNIWLNGTDVDMDTIIAVRVTSLPMYGNLSQDGNNITLTNLPYPTSGDGNGTGYVIQYIMYVAAGINAQNFVLNDSFTFGVQDVHGNWSDNNATVTISVFNNLEAQLPSGPISVLQPSNTSTPTLIKLAGIDASGANNFNIIIVSAPDQGTFYEADGVTPVPSFPFNAYDDAAAPTGQDIFIYYKGPAYGLQPTNFTYQIVTPDGWKSPVGAAQISAAPQNYPPTITLNSPATIVIGNVLDGLLNMSFFDWDNATEDNGVGAGYLVTAQLANSAIQLGSVQPYIACGACINYLQRASCGVGCIPDPLDLPSQKLFSYYGSKGANFSYFLLSLQNIGLKRGISGQGALRITIQNGINGPGFGQDASSKTSASVTVNFQVQEKEGNQGTSYLPDWATYVVYIVGPIFFICILFFCVRWCMRCCLCCQFGKNKKTEPYEGYETTATDRL